MNAEQETANIAELAGAANAAVKSVTDSIRDENLPDSARVRWVVAAIDSLDALRLALAKRNAEGSPGYFARGEKHHPTTDGLPTEIALRLFINGIRVGSHQLTGADAVCFFAAAAHLQSYLFENYPWCEKWAREKGIHVRPKALQDCLNPHVLHEAGPRLGDLNDARRAILTESDRGDSGTVIGQNAP